MARSRKARKRRKRRGDTEGEGPSEVNALEGLHPHLVFALTGHWDPTGKKRAGEVETFAGELDARRINSKVRRPAKGDADTKQRPK